MKKTFPLLTMFVAVLLVTACIIPTATTLPPTQAPATLAPIVKPPTAISIPPTEPTGPRPEQPLSASGPWYIFWGVDGLYAMNTDGNGASRLIEVDPQETPIIFQYHISSVSPNGGRVALTKMKGSDPDTLLILQLPEGNVVAQFPLMSAGLEMTSWSAGESVWSPDGTKLAYISAENGVSADVYLYTLATGKTVRLTTGADQAAGLSWSPDGKYIFNVAVANFGTGAGQVVSGVWATTPGGNSTYLYDPYPYAIPASQQVPGHTSMDSGGEELFEWTGDHTFLARSWNVICGYHGLRSFDIDTLKTTVYWQECFTHAAYSPAYHAFLVSTEYGASAAGTYLITTPGHSVRLADAAQGIMWSDVSDAFLVVLNEQVQSIHADGQGGHMPFTLSALPDISPDGTTWVWEDGDGMYVGEVLSGRITVLVSALGRSAWQPGTNNLIVCADGHIYTAEAPDYITNPIANPVSDCQDAQIVP